MLFKGWGEHGYNHTGNGFACICDAREKETSRKLTGDRKNILQLSLPFICRDLAYEEEWWCLKQVITHCYTPLHRKLGILTPCGWQVKYLNQEIEEFKSKHTLRGHAAVIDPSYDIQARLVFGHFFEKSPSVNLCWLLHTLGCNTVTLYSSAQNHYDLFQQKVLILFLELFVGQRRLNITVP